MGDPSGIGPEVLSRALRQKKVSEALVPVVFGDGPTLRGLLKGLKFEFVSELSTRPTRPTVCEVTALSEKDRLPGRPTRRGGQAQHAYVIAAVEAAKRGWVDGLCT